MDFGILDNEIPESLLNAESASQLKEIKKQLPCKCPSVLLVDDEPFNIMALEGLLHQRGIENCAKAYQGALAVSLLLQNLNQPCSNHRPFRVVITDNKMPVMGGVEAAREIRKLQSEGNLSKKTKVALLTGDGFLVNEEDGKLFDLQLEKPIDKFQLTKILSLMAE
jgi:CheY-like chemotaxis protein